MFYKRRVLIHFAKFMGKHLCWSLFFNNFIKKRLQHKCFPVDFSKFLRTPFFRTSPVAASDRNIFIELFSHLLSINQRFLQRAFNYENARTMNKICSKLTIKTTTERRYWCRSDVFIVTFEQISKVFMVFPLLTLNN